MSSRPRRSVSSAVCSTATTRLAALLALPALLVACGDDGHGGHGGDGKEPAAVQTARDGEEFNQVDVDFATAMIPHHAQAVQMANLAEDRPLSPELRTLVEGIHTAQVSEVETMVTWLTDWGQEIPETSMDHVNGGHGHPEESANSADTGDSEHDAGHSEDMPGMMSAARMAELEQASDAEFPALWLTMMIEHHRGAIEMARTEQDDGHATDAVELARTIADTQAEEITSMEALLEQG